MAMTARNLLVPDDDPTTEAWIEAAATIDRLNRTNPPLALETASEWLARERACASPEGTARALRAHGHALRYARLYDEAIGEYEDAEARFIALGLPAEAART